MREDYVSFEIAKFLKEKGFDWICSVVYDLERPKSCKDNKYYTNFGTLNHNKWPDLVSAPTLQMAMKWLREVKNIFISVDYSYICGQYKHTICLADSSLNHKYGANVDYDYKTYEEAVEAALKYALTNII